ncbi:MAG TPA: hypothetical protein PKX16_01755 [Kiritimatiellia bacterium]|nr:hypothetical protein [Kiritimatiellia bacterium]
MNHFYTEQELVDFLGPHIAVVRTRCDQTNEMLQALCRYEA